MEKLSTMTYEVDGRVARIALDRPERGNGITFEMPRELAHLVERADLDARVHVIALSGNGKGFCGGYDLRASAEALGRAVDSAGAADASEASDAHDARNAHDARSATDADAAIAELGGATAAAPDGSPLDPRVVAANHDPNAVWDPVCDYQMMARNVRGFMSLFHADKPVVCKVHGFCVAGGTDMALCSDLLIIADDAKIGYPPARVWGVPTTAVWAFRIGPEKAKRLLFTGDCLDGREAVAWGLACEHAPPDALDARTEALLGRIARLPVNQLVMMKRLVNQTMQSAGLAATQLVGTMFDGVARHTREGYAFQQRAFEVGFKQAVRERDEPFGDFGASSYKGPIK